MMRILFLLPLPLFTDNANKKGPLELRTAQRRGTLEGYGRIQCLGHAALKNSPCRILYAYLVLLNALEFKEDLLPFKWIYYHKAGANFSSISIKKLKETTKSQI